MASLTQIEILLPELRAYAFSLVRVDHEAEDLAQDAVERALRSDQRPAKLNDLRPWMFRVLRNLRYDELRKRRVRQEYSAGLRRYSEEVSQTRDHAHSVLVRNAYNKLPEPAREILFLIDIMGLKYDEAALVLDVPRGTIMSRISRARRAMMELVEGVQTPKMEHRK